MDAFTITFIIVGSLAGLIILITFFGGRRLKAILAEGIGIVFVGEPRKYLELIAFEHNQHTDKVMLVLVDPSNWGEIFKTGFYFSPDDFSPNPLFLNWESYTGTIVCWRNIEGKGDARETLLNEAYRKIRQQKEQLQIHKQLEVQAVREYGLQTVMEKRKEETFHKAGVLRDLKKLTQEAQVVEKSDDDAFKRLLNK